MALRDGPVRTSSLRRSRTPITISPMPVARTTYHSAIKEASMAASSSTPTDRRFCHSPVSDSLAVPLPQDDYCKDQADRYPVDKPSFMPFPNDVSFNCCREVKLR